MTNWKETILGELPIRIGDGNYSSKYPNSSELLNEGIPFISNRDLKNGGISNSGLRYLSAQKHAELLKGHIKSGDVLVSTRANIGDIALVTDEFDDANINAQLVFLRSDEQIIHSKYLFYLLSSKTYRQIFQNFSSGSVQAQLPIHSLKKIPVRYPEILEQKEIAGVFSSLDDKIELLREENKTLEATAQTIFKEWFVNFNFPNAEGKPYKSSGGKMIDSELGEIPEGWGVGTVKDVIKKYSISYRCDKDDLDPKGKTQIFDQGSAGLYGYTSREADFEASTEDPVILFTNHTCNMWFVNYPFCAIQNVLPFRGNNEYSTFFVFYMTLGQISFIEYKGHWPDFEHKKYIIPMPNIANEFAEIAKPLQYKIWNNNSQIQTLSTLRDTLLQKLMSGKLLIS